MFGKFPVLPNGMSVIVIASHENKSSYILPVTLIIDKWIFQCHPHYSFKTFIDHSYIEINVYDKINHRWISIYNPEAISFLSSFRVEHPNFKNYYYQSNDDAFFTISEKAIREIYRISSV